MNAHLPTPDADTIARALGGEVLNKEGRPYVVAPGPGHSKKDRSLSVLIGSEFPDGLWVTSHAGDDPIVCKDYVNQKLGRPTWGPQEGSENIIGRTTAKARVAQRANDHDKSEETAKRFWDGFLTGKGFEQVAVYHYAVAGELLYQVLRYEHPMEDKKFIARRPDGKGGWLFGAGDRRVLYRIDDLEKVAHVTAFVTEGEKDADRLASLGFIAVTVAFGDWSEEAIKALAGYDVRILEDNDETGRKKAREAAEALHGVAGTVRIVRLPGLGERQDVSDWLDAGNDHNLLVAIAKAAPLWEPPNAESSSTVNDELGPRADAGGSHALPFVGFDDLQVELQKPWLLKNVIAKGETSSWIGGPGKGKSAFLTDVAIHVGAERDWRGYKSKGKFGVVYLAFERGDLVKRRLEAYKRKYGFKGLPIVVVTTPVNLMEPGAIAVVVATINAVVAKYGVEVGLLIMDTFAKAIAYGGGDEDRAKDQNRLRGHLREIQRITNVHIALVGHTGKDEARGERGSNANLGDVDVEVRITGDLVKTAIVTKANDQPEGPLTKFTLEAYELAVDEDGEAVTTALISAEAPDEGNMSPARSARRLNHGEQVALKLLKEAISEAGKKPPANDHIPDGIKAITKDLWRRYCYQGGISAVDAAEDARKKAFQRAVKSLQMRGFIGVWEPHVWVACSD